MNGGLSRASRMTVAAAVVAAAIGSCGGGTAGTHGALPTDGGRSRRFVLLTVDSARISPTLSSGEAWDVDASAAEAEHESESRHAVGALLGLVAEPIGIVFEALSALSSQPPPGDSPAAYPDPVVRVAFHGPAASRTLSSNIAFDTLRPAWALRAFVAIDELDDSGLTVEIDDFDRTTNTRIGSVQIPRAELEAVARGEARDIIAHDHEMEELRLRIAPVFHDVRATATAIRLDLHQGMVATGLEVPFHAMVAVQVRGAGRVAAGGFGSCSPTATVTPAGLPSHFCQQYNLTYTGLRDAPHACGVALLGTGTAMQAVPLVDGASTTPSRQFLAPAPGELVLGVNDKDLGNDSGEFVFEVTVTPPPEDRAAYDRAATAAQAEAVASPGSTPEGATSGDGGDAMRRRLRETPNQKAALPR